MRVTCAELESALSMPPQCCCRVANLTSCLPRVIIAGAQKSGSTALFGHLLLHPNFSASKRKELHSFDKPRNWQKDENMVLRAYMQQFEPYNPMKVST